MFCFDLTFILFMELVTKTPFHVSLDVTVLAFVCS